MAAREAELGGGGEARGEEPGADPQLGPLGGLPGDYPAPLSFLLYINRAVSQTKPPGSMAFVEKPFLS